VGWPTSASIAVPPFAGLGTVATGWHPAIASTAAKAAAARLREMRYHPDVGDRADQECGHDDPRRPVDLALEAAPAPISAHDAVAAAADRAAESRRLRGLDRNPGLEEQGKPGLRTSRPVW